MKPLRRLDLCLVLLFMVFGVVGCARPSLSIVKEEFRSRDNPYRSEFYLTIKNVGSADAYDVQAIYDFYKGNTVIETGTASIYRIKEGKSYREKMYLSEIDTSKDFSHCDAKLYWYDRAGLYYD